jgi:hypothetical protein
MQPVMAAGGPQPFTASGGHGPSGGEENGKESFIQSRNRECCASRISRGFFVWANVEIIYNLTHVETARPYYLRGYRNVGSIADGARSGRRRSDIVRGGFDPEKTRRARTKVVSLHRLAERTRRLRRDHFGTPTRFEAWPRSEIFRSNRRSFKGALVKVGSVFTSTGIGR